MSDQKNKKYQAAFQRLSSVITEAVTAQSLPESDLNSFIQTFLSLPNYCSDINEEELFKAKESQQNLLTFYTWLEQVTLYKLGLAQPDPAFSEVQQTLADAINVDYLSRKFVEYSHLELIKKKGEQALRERLLRTLLPRLNRLHDTLNANTPGQLVASVQLEAEAIFAYFDDPLLASKDKTAYGVCLNQILGNPKAKARWEQLLWFCNRFQRPTWACFVSDCAGIQLRYVDALITSNVEMSRSLAKEPEFVVPLYRWELYYAWLHSPCKQIKRHTITALVLSIPLAYVVALMVAFFAINPITGLMTTFGLMLPTTLHTLVATWWGAALASFGLSLCAWPLLGILTTVGEMLATTLNYLHDFLFCTPFRSLATQIPCALLATTAKVASWLLYGLCNPWSSLQNVIGRDSLLFKKHVIESDLVPAARILRRNRFVERLADTFYCLHGHAMKRRILGKTKLHSTHGVLDLLCLGVPHWSWLLMSTCWQGSKEQQSLPWLMVAAVLASLAYPLNVLKAVVAATLAFILIPVIFMVHLVCWRKAVAYEKQLANIKLIPAEQSSSSLGTSLTRDNFPKLFSGEQHLVPYALETNNSAYESPMSSDNATKNVPNSLFLHDRNFGADNWAIENSTMAHGDAKISVSDLSNEAYHALLCLNVGGIVSRIEKSGGLSSLFESFQAVQP